MPEKSLLEKIREIAYKHALLNAYKHGGKAELKPVVSKVMGELPEARSIAREVVGIVREIVEEVNKLSFEEQRKILEKNWPDLLAEEKREEKKELPPLPNAIPGKVTTRFAPNPDYTIHLGNARPALLSYWYARMYSGRMILRFEDTDPRTKAPFPEAYERIKEDLRWLGIEWDEEYIQSLRLPIFYDVVRELIRRRGAYVDKCSDKEFKEYRNRGKACPHRELPVETQLEELDRILEGYYGEGEAVIRVKTDMQHPDPSVRDWVALRIIDTSKTPHPVVGDKYILWPTYNFAAAVDDHLMGVTHILRAKEHVTNTIKQKYLYDHMGWKYPETIHFGRLSLEDVILSKSKMRKMILEMGLQPYDDPRFGTISGLRRRGFVREAIWEVVKQVGIKQVDAQISFANLASINRSIVDPIAKRYMAVENPVVVRLKLEDTVKAVIPRHPATGEKYEYVFERGEHHVLVSARDLEYLRKGIVRLMGFVNISLEGLEVSNNSIIARASVLSVSPEEAKKKKFPIIQWVRKEDSITLLMLKPEATRIEKTYMIAEKAIMERNIGDIVQLYRIGFARIDEKSDDVITCIYAHP